MSDKKDMQHLVDEEKRTLDRAILEGLTKYNKQLSNENKIAIALMLLKNNNTESPLGDLVDEAITKLGSRLL